MIGESGGGRSRAMDGGTVVALRLRIRGRVQGVGYRVSMAREAHRLGVSGWVRNRADGSVEALLRGDGARVQALVDWARRGPPAARVNGLEMEAADAGPADAGFTGFEQRPTV